jgi:Cu2+-exporting ATPase
MANLTNNRKGTFPVLKMACAGCAANVQKTLQQQPGVYNANVNLASKNVVLEYDPSITDTERLQAVVRSIGYDLLITEEDEDPLSSGVEVEERRQYRRLKERTSLSVLLTVLIVALSMTPLMHHRWTGFVAWILSTPVLFFCGRQFFSGALKQAGHRSMNMDTLVALSTVTAYLFSVFNLLFPGFWASRGLSAGIYFETAAVIISFILLGRLLEERARQKTSAAVKKLIGLQPQTATLVRDGEIVEIPVKNIRVDDVVVVRPGEKIAVDGIITEGHSFVDESMLTGEPVLSEKMPEHTVFAGTINQQGSFRFRAVKVGRETLLAQIIHLVKEAQNSKAPIQKTVDKIAGIFVPIVVVIALFSAVLWLYLGKENSFVHALLAFVTVLIISCPCALGLATPTAIIVGMGKGAGLGILIKNMDSLELLRKVDTIVLDKTGTITKGMPVVTDVRWIEEKALYRDILFSMENASGHPLSRAIIETLPGAKLLETLTVEVKPGAGIVATTGEGCFFAGNIRLFSTAFLDQGLTEWIREKEEESKTVVLFGSSDKVLAAFSLADEMKDTSRQAIEQLQQAGIEIIMATGDSEASAKEIARQAGIRHVLAKALPEDKLNLIRERQREGKIVAMVGDGINDSAALAGADISIAMGTGSDIAIDAASVTIVSGDLRKISVAIRLSQNTVKTIRQNLFWAFIYNLLAIPLAAGILYPFNGFLLNPMIAGAAMALSSVSVVTNSLRLNFKTYA